MTLDGFVTAVSRSATHTFSKPNQQSGRYEVESRQTRNRRGNRPAQPLLPAERLSAGPKGGDVGAGRKREPRPQGRNHGGRPRRRRGAAGRPDRRRIAAGASPITGTGLSRDRGGDSA